MDRNEFLALLEDEFSKIVEINKTKGHDYAGDQDALANFKAGAARLGLTPVQVWGVYASKHWSAIETFIKEGDVKSEPIEGRIQDAILYLFLLMGLIQDERKSKQEDDRVTRVRFE